MTARSFKQNIFLIQYQNMKVELQKPKSSISNITSINLKTSYNDENSESDV